MTNLFIRITPMPSNRYSFHDLFDQLGLPSSEEAISQFLRTHSPLPNSMLLVDAPFWDVGQAEFLREKKAIDDPVWVPLIDQLSEALRNTPPSQAHAAHPKLLGISGSLSAGSFNTALLHAAGQALADSAHLAITTLHGIPLYDSDLEASSGLPGHVITLRQRIASADGLVIATPEYNHGIPGVMKNALDWVSRVSNEHPNVLKGKPVALIGASTGGFGTAYAQMHWLPVLHALGMQLWAEKSLLVSRAQNLIQQDQITDAALAQQVTDYIHGFARFVAAQTTRPSNR